MADSPAMNRRNMQTLQQEAIRRAREMQARARIPSSYAPGHGPERAQRPAMERPPVREAAPEPPPPRPDPPPRMGRSAPVRVPPAAPPEEKAPPDGTFDLLFKDSERSLIMMLLLILLEEKADNTLIFALMYLLL